MSDFKNTGQFTSVVGISGKRRMPRLGKIRLGVKVKKAGSNTEYPIELPFFLVPDEVAAYYALGDKAYDRAVELGYTRSDGLNFIKANGHRLAEELDIMFPMNDQQTIFPQSYRLYGSSRGAKCIGNGEKAVEMRYDEAGKPLERIDKECPCPELDKERGGCSLKGFLMVMLPKVNVGGIYQITVGSYNSVVDVNSGIAYTQGMIGRAAMVPLKLRRIPTITHGSGKKETHYTLQVTLDLKAEELESARLNTNSIIASSQALALPAPEDVAPEFDESEVYEAEVEDVEAPHEPQNEAQEAETEAETGADSPEAGETPSEGNSERSERVDKGNLGIINGLMNGIGLAKAMEKRVAWARERLLDHVPPGDLDNLKTLADLTPHEAQVLIGILKQGG